MCEIERKRERASVGKQVCQLNDAPIDLFTSVSMSFSNAQSLMRAQVETGFV